VFLIFDIFAGQTKLLLVIYWVMPMKINQKYR